MALIDNISNIPPDLSKSQRNDIQKKVSQKESKVEKSPLKKPTVTNTKEDAVQVSSAGKSLLKSSKAVGDYLKEIDSVRNLSGEEAKYIEAKIESGFYSNPAVIQKVAQAISQELNVQNAKAVHSGLNVERLQEIVSKIRNKDYESDNIANVIADRLIKDL